MFSILDAYAYHLKQAALHDAADLGVVFSAREMEFIHEQKQHHGKTTQKMIPTGENLRFAISTYAYVHGRGDLPFAGDLPPEFEHARKLRNRITHPKKGEDLDVSREDAYALATLFLWFREVTEWENHTRKHRIEELRDQALRRTQALREKIQAAGPVAKFEGTIEELYTAPKLSKRPRNKKRAG